MFALVCTALVFATVGGVVARTLERMLLPQLAEWGALPVPTTFALEVLPPLAFIAPIALVVALLMRRRVRIERLLPGGRAFDVFDALHLRVAALAAGAPAPEKPLDQTPALDARERALGRRLLHRHDAQVALRLLAEALEGDVWRALAVQRVVFTALLVVLVLASMSMVSAMFLPVFTIAGAIS